MSIPPVTSFFSKPPSIDTCQIEATRLFGNDLAESLYSRDQSWEKVMLSWNVSLEALRIIKESNIEVTIMYCETQSNDGLIAEISTKLGDEDTSEVMSLITPYGSLTMKFEDNESMNQFIGKLASKFYKQPFTCQGNQQIRWSFTLNPNITASYKPSHYFDQCGYKLEEEFGKDEYTRTQALEIYDLLRSHTDINIHGQAIPL